MQVEISQHIMGQLEELFLVDAWLAGIVAKFLVALPEYLELVDQDDFQFIHFAVSVPDHQKQIPKG